MPFRNLPHANNGKRRPAGPWGYESGFVEDATLDIAREASQIIVHLRSFMMPRSAKQREFRGVDSQNKSLRTSTMDKARGVIRVDMAGKSRREALKGRSRPPPRYTESIKSRAPQDLSDSGAHK
uniref:Uncharacterized protein n=1 Tax=Ananas comosus var. bracteatus TaxID=296719 RepID=A0A6V7QFB6_ANACO|nr:unnamed protein product [Ananas comosus var. bracteatus]